MTSEKRVRRGLDRVAIAASGICTVHCLLGPLFVALFPVLATLGLPEEAFHRQLSFLVFPTSIVGLMLGCVRHRDWRVLALGSLGLAALALAVGAGHAWLGEVGERAVMVLGGLSAASAHVRNYRLCHDDRCHR